MKIVDKIVVNRQVFALIFRNRCYRCPKVLVWRKAWRQRHMWCEGGLKISISGTPSTLVYFEQYWWCSFLLRCT